jgi:hypothetical protein
MRRRSLLGMLVLPVVALGLALVVNEALQNVFSLQAASGALDTSRVVLKALALLIGSAIIGLFAFLLAGWLLTGEIRWIRSPTAGLVAMADDLMRSRTPRQRVPWVVISVVASLTLNVVVLFLGFQVARANLVVWSSGPAVEIAVATIAGTALLIVLLGTLVGTQIVYFRWLRSSRSSNRK